MPDLSLFLQSSCYHRDLHSFPTRRSSDLPMIFMARPSSFCAIRRSTPTSFSPARREHPNPKSSCTSSALKRAGPSRSEEHTSELQSHHDLVCRLLLEKKKNKTLSRGGDAN